MKLELQPPSVDARLHGRLDIAVCIAGTFIGVLVGTWLYPGLQREPAFSVGWFLVFGILAIPSAMAIGGVLVPFYRMRVGAKYIEYGLLRMRRIEWERVIEFRYLGLVPNMGFTERAFFRTDDGRSYIVPAADERLRAYLNALAPIEKMRPNQPVQHNAGSRPSSDVCPAFTSRSVFAPRG